MIDLIGTDELTTILIISIKMFSECMNVHTLAKYRNQLLFQQILEDFIIINLFFIFFNILYFFVIKKLFIHLYKKILTLKIQLFVE